MRATGSCVRSRAYTTLFAIFVPVAKGDLQPSAADAAEVASPFLSDY